jgi:hypothetical protein
MFYGAGIEPLYTLVTAAKNKGIVTEVGKSSRWVYKTGPGDTDVSKSVLGEVGFLEHLQANPEAAALIAAQLGMGWPEVIQRGSGKKPSGPATLRELPDSAIASEASPAEQEASLDEV